MSSETISLIGAGAVALLSIICNVISIIVKNKKQSMLESENKTNTKEKTMLEIMENIPKYVQQAEQIFNQSGTGVAKKTYVENLIKMDCIERNLPFDENKTSEKIEQVLETPTKKTEKVGNLNNQYY